MAITGDTPIEEEGHRGGARGISRRRATAPTSSSSEGCAGIRKRKGFFRRSASSDGSAALLVPAKAGLVFVLVLLLVRPFSVDGAPWYSSFFGNGGSDVADNSDKEENSAAKSEQTTTKQTSSATTTTAATASAATAAEDSEEDVLVSSVVNRELELSVVAHAWPSSPQNVLCEAYAYHQQQKSEDEKSREDLSFLKNLARLVMGDNNDDDREGPYAASSYHDAVDLALRASSTTAPSSPSTKLLELTLSMRAMSVACELHRGLAKQTLLRATAAGGDFNDGDDVLAVLYPPGQVLRQPDLLSLLSAEDQGDSPFSNVSSDTGSRQLDLLQILLPDEIPIGQRDGGDDDKDAPLIVLYGNFGTQTFASVFTKLLELAGEAEGGGRSGQGSIRFVVR